MSKYNPRAVHRLMQRSRNDSSENDNKTRSNHRITRGRNHRHIATESSYSNRGNMQRAGITVPNDHAQDDEGNETDEDDDSSM